MKNIYIAEDEPSQAELMRAALEDLHDCNVAFFADGLKLYEEVQDHPPQLLILDIILPSLSGLAVTALLKFHDHYGKIPVLVVSSITEKDLRDRVLAMGADVFLQKPLRVDEFLKEVNRLLEAASRHV